MGWGKCQRSCRRLGRAIDGDRTKQLNRESFAIYYFQFVIVGFAKLDCRIGVGVDSTQEGIANSRNQSGDTEERPGNVFAA